MNRVQKNDVKLVQRAQSAQALTKAEASELRAFFTAPTIDRAHVERAEQLVDGALARRDGPDVPAATTALGHILDRVHEQMRDLGKKKDGVDRGASAKSALREALGSLLGNKLRVTQFAWDPSNRSVMSPPGLGTLLVTPLLIGIDLISGPIVAAVKVGEATQDGAKWVNGDRLPADVAQARRADADRAESVAAALTQLNDDPNVAKLGAYVKQQMKHYGSSDPFYCIALTGSSGAGGGWSHAEEARLVVSPKGIELHPKNTYVTRSLTTITGAVRHPDVLAHVSVDAIKRKVDEVVARLGL